MPKITNNVHADTYQPTTNTPRWVVNYREGDKEEYRVIGIHIWTLYHKNTALNLN